MGLRSSPALFDAMQRPRQEPAARRFVPAGVEEPSAMKALAKVSPPSERVDALPVLPSLGNPTVAPAALRGRTAARQPA